MHDDDPIVILDTAQEVAALPAAVDPSSSEAAALLPRLAAACQALLPAHPPTCQYLASLGLDAPSLHAAYRLGAATSDTYAAFAADRPALQRLGLWAARGGNNMILAGPGCCWFTYDPRDPHHPVGVVRLNRAQNKHRFVTRPVGLGCQTDLADHRRLVLVDHPILTLRLAALGVPGVALVEDPVVLEPLADWLTAREIILLSHKRHDLDAMSAVLGTIPHRAHLIGNQVEHLGDEVRALLALPAPPPPPRSDPTPHLLHRIWQYSQARLRAGDGIETLRERGLAQADLLAAYGAGYLPADWRTALSQADAAAVSGLLVGNTLVLPALDEAGEVVDLLACRLHQGGGLLGCWDEPRGLVGSRIATACRSVILVDRVSDLVRLWTAGQRNVLLLRGVEDLRLNAARLHTAGIREARIDTWHDRPGCTAACVQAGIATSDGPTLICNPNGFAPGPAASDDDEPVVILDEEEVSSPAGSPPLVLLSHDPDRALATFQAGEITYVVELPFDATTTTLEVLARRLGQVHRDRFDLASEAQRGRYAEAAGRRLEVEGQIIAGHLVEILAQVHDLVAPPAQPAAPLPADPDTATLLRDPDLLGRLVASLDGAGWVGDDQAKRLGLLTLAGRLLDDPPWLILRGPASATAQPLGLLAECLPPDARLHGGRISEAGLYHQDRDALHHRVLVLDDASRLRPEITTALRVLQARGSLTFQHAERDPVTGRLKTRAGEAHGPVALLACTQDATPLDALAMSIHLDDSAEQTARVLDAQARRRQGGGDQRAQTVERLRGVFSALVGQRVLIPYADRIQFPATRLEHRRDHDRFLSLIEASTLLHQFQRTRVDGAVMANEADFHQAVKAADGVLGREEDGVGGRAGQILRVMAGEPDWTWTLNDFTTCFPEMSRVTLWRVLGEMTRTEILTATAGKGRQARQYSLKDGIRVNPGHGDIRLAANTYDTPGRQPRSVSAFQGVECKMKRESRDGDRAYA